MTLLFRSSYSSVSHSLSVVRCCGRRVEHGPEPVRMGETSEVLILITREEEEEDVGRVDDDN